MPGTGHTVTVPSSLTGPEPRAPQTIAIPEALEGPPGTLQDAATVDWYSIHFPLESDAVENPLYRQWARRVGDIREIREHHEKLNAPLVAAAANSGDQEPTARPTLGLDVTPAITSRALEVGFSMVGFTAYDHRYTYRSSRRWVKPFPNAICLALEQPYESAQAMPSPHAQEAAFATYRRMGSAALELADHIRSLGYRAQIQSPSASSSAVIPMFVEAGMGQVGANGYLLSPHFGPRHRLMLVTTDALVTHGSPVDYGIPAFCILCQICVNRCPGRALARERVWWRGVEKFKVVAKRCRPVMARYSGCGVCMTVCPIQRYGLKEVMEHYGATGEILGKFSHLLEGFEMDGLGYFPPNQMPTFGSNFFNLPEGRPEQQVLQELRARIDAGHAAEGALEELGPRLVEALQDPGHDHLDDQDEF